MSTIEKISLQPIQSYIKSKWGADAMSEPQIKAIANRVLQSMGGQMSPSSKTDLPKIMNRMIKSGASPWKQQLSPKTPLASLIFSHIKGDPPSLKDLFADKTLLKSFFLSPNPELMKEVRTAVQAIYCDIWRSIQENPPKSKAEHFHYEAIITNLAAFFSYQNALQDEVLQIPVRVEGTWQMVAYQIDRLRLTPSWLGSPIVAFGLKSKTPQAPPLLIFKGTTRPADDGSSLSILTDINPGASVGSYAFHLGKKTIRKWLQANTTATNRAITLGTSLGGAQSWRTALHFPDKIKEVWAFCSPGFSFANLKRLKKIQKLASPPKIRLLYHYNDPVSYVDFPASKGAKYYEIFGEKIKKGVGAHTTLYSLHNKSTILKMDAETIKAPWKRVGLTIARIAATILCFIPFLTIHLIQTGIRATLSRCKDQKNRPLFFKGGKGAFLPQSHRLAKNALFRQSQLPHAG